MRTRNAFETLILSIVRMNQAEKKTEIKKKWNCGPLSLSFSWRSKKNLWGRFGGGWNWKLGFQASSLRHVIISLLFFQISWTWGRK